MQYPWPYPQWPSHCPVPTAPTAGFHSPPCLHRQLRSTSLHLPSCHTVRPLHLTCRPLRGHTPYSHTSNLHRLSCHLIMPILCHIRCQQWNQYQYNLHPLPLIHRHRNIHRHRHQPHHFHMLSRHHSRQRNQYPSTGTTSQGIWQPYSLFPPVLHPPPHRQPAPTPATSSPPDLAPANPMAPSPAPVDPGAPQLAASALGTPQPAATATATSGPPLPASTALTVPHQQSLRHYLRTLENDHMKRLHQPLHQGALLSRPQLHLHSLAPPLQPANTADVTAVIATTDIGATLVTDTPATTTQLLRQSTKARRDASDAAVLPPPHTPHFPAAAHAAAPMRLSPCDPTRRQHGAMRSTAKLQHVPS